MLRRGGQPRPVLPGSEINRPSPRKNMAIELEFVEVLHCVYVQILSSRSKNVMRWEQIVFKEDFKSSRNGGPQPAKQTVPLGQDATALVAAWAGRFRGWGHGSASNHSTLSGQCLHSEVGCDVYWKVMPVHHFHSKLLSSNVIVCFDWWWQEHGDWSVHVVRPCNRQYGRMQGDVCFAAWSWE